MEPSIKKSMHLRKRVVVVAEPKSLRRKINATNDAKIGAFTRRRY
jgi:hypothetical protein